jgi:hypothetical protein
MTRWCMIIMRRIPVRVRRIPCSDDDLGTPSSVDEPVAAFGPFTKATAELKAERFNKSTADGNRVSILDPEPEEYRPVPNAPDFIAQEQWIEHWAIVRPMNWEELW